jgi:hypothetical protein
MVGRDGDGQPVGCGAREAGGGRQILQAAGSRLQRPEDDGDLVDHPDTAYTLSHMSRLHLRM